MAIFTIGDLHLSFGSAKPMDVFRGWEGYQERIREHWLSHVSPGDTVVLAGDTSWGMTMEEAMRDFLWLEELPGKKLLLKGNHDYWWGSVTSMKRALAEQGITSLDFLHNNSFFAEGLNLCGSRGWLFETGERHDEKIIRREAGRIEASLKSAVPGFPCVLFLHYPPVYGNQEMALFLDLMRTYGIRRCYYGHIHGAGGHRYAVDGVYAGLEFRLISADYLRFAPAKVVIEDSEK